MEVIKFMSLLTAKLLVFIIASFILGFSPMVMMRMLLKLLGKYSFTVFFQMVGVYIVSLVFSVVAAMLIYKVTTEQFENN